MEEKKGEAGTPSVGLRDYIVYIVSESILENKELSHLKYLEKYCAFEGCDYHSLQENLIILVDAIQEYKKNKSKVFLKIAKYQMKFCYLPEDFIEHITEEPVQNIVSSVCHYSYSGSRGGDIFNEMPGGKLLKNNVPQKKKEKGSPKGIVAIDLGLPSGTKWASCNVGAKKPEESGGYYAWGEIKEKDRYGWEHYQHCNGSKDNCHFLGFNITATQYDVATMILGDPWRMPTPDDIMELTDYCTYVWTTKSGVKGGKFTGPNGNSIFLPAVGYRYYAQHVDCGKSGIYLSSESGDLSDEHLARVFTFDEDDDDYDYWMDRAWGFSIRAVM